MSITFTTGKNRPPKRGVAIIMAIILASELVIVGAAIHAVSLREQQLVTLADDSVRAYAAAESAIECLLFQDTRIGNFGSETPIVFECGTTWNIPNYVPDEEDDDVIIGIPDSETREYSPPGSEAVGYTGYPNGPCADVWVYKSVAADGEISTFLRANGRNSCEPTLRRLERGVTIYYPWP